eukprot:11177460-Lingulodinium_polyedra.AAC.1
MTSPHRLPRPHHGLGLPVGVQDPPRLPRGWPPAGHPRLALVRYGGDEHSVPREVRPAPGVHPVD